mgnify:CR=1 FL=1
MKEYLEWEQRIEMVFDWQSYTKEQKVKLAALEFMQSCGGSKTRLVVGGIESQKFAWDELKVVMRKRFVPSHYYRDLYHKLQILTQGNRSMNDYFKEMEIIMLRANIVEDRESTMAWFFCGLRPKIAELVKLQTYVEFRELEDKASKIERRQKKRGNIQPSTTPTTPS